MTDVAKIAADAIKLAEMVKQHERTAFVGPDATKLERAAWRGIVRKAA
jgi:hypothetical protein